MNDDELNLKDSLLEDEDILPKFLIQRKKNLTGSKMKKRMTKRMKRKGGLCN